MLSEFKTVMEPLVVLCIMRQPGQLRNGEMKYLVLHVVLLVHFKRGKEKVTLLQEKGDQIQMQADLLEL